ncbi:hypothetical protein AN167_25350, partial [Vibrio splendidus]
LNLNVKNIVINLINWFLYLIIIIKYKIFTDVLSGAYSILPRLVDSSRIQIIIVILHGVSFANLGVLVS